MIILAVENGKSNISAKTKARKSPGGEDSKNRYRPALDVDRSVDHGPPPNRRPRRRAAQVGSSYPVPSLDAESRAGCAASHSQLYAIHGGGRPLARMTRPGLSANPWGLRRPPDEVRHHRSRPSLAGVSPTTVSRPQRSRRGGADQPGDGGEGSSRRPALGYVPNRIASTLGPPLAADHRGATDEGHHRDAPGTGKRRRAPMKRVPQILVTCAPCGAPKQA